MQVKFTDKAIAHLENIIDIFLYYAGERSAAKFSKLVDDKIDKISHFPYIGFIESRFCPTGSFCLGQQSFMITTR